MKRSGTKNNIPVMGKWTLSSVLLVMSFVSLGQDFKYSMISSDESGNTYDFRILYKNVNIQLNQDVCYYWYRNGRLGFNMGNYSANLLDGKYEKFDLKGKLCEKGNFKFGTKDGNWTYWDTNGNIKKEERWNKGYLKLKRSIDKDSVVVENYKNNLLHGTRSVQKNGQILLSQQYKKGKLKKERDYTLKPTPSKSKYQAKRKADDAVVKK